MAAVITTKVLGEHEEGGIVLETGPGDDKPLLTGFEDASTKSLILANDYLRRAGVPTLRPVLPLLLSLKGKPYNLRDHFPFSPFFRTRMPQAVLLITGRQVSKCGWADELLHLWNGESLRLGDAQVGMVVSALDRSTERFVPRKITNVWQRGRKRLVRLLLADGTSVCVTLDHRLLVRDGDNHFQCYTETRHIYRGDYLATRTPPYGALAWIPLRAIEDVGEAETCDIEVEVDNNFLLGTKNGVVSHNSTSLAAHGIVLANSIPYFSILYVTPLFEMVRRFSHNYVREFIDTSPVRRLFISQKTTNQILQRSFLNGSAMYFSYAFLDAERTRGIPASANVVDESFKIGTMIRTPVGSQSVESFQPGDPVLSFDESGNVCKDEVVTCSDHGVRDCYRFDFADGTALEATSDSWLATEAGWKRVAAAIADAHVNTVADGVGDNARRRPHAIRREKSDISKQSRLQAARIQLSQVPGIIRVRTHATQTEEESRLRRMVQLLGDSNRCGLTSYRFLVSPQRPQARDQGVVGPVDLGGRGLVVSGRRRPFSTDGELQHARLSGGGSAHAGDLADSTRRQRQGDAGSSQTRRLLLDRQVDRGLDSSLVGEGRRVHSHEPTLQAVVTAASAGNLRLLQQDFLPDRKGPSALQAGNQDVVLRHKVLPAFTGASALSPCQHETRSARATQRKRAAPLLQEPEAVTCSQPRKNASASLARSRRSEQVPAPPSATESGCEAQAALDLSALRQEPPARPHGPEDTLLRALPQARHVRAEGKLPERSDWGSSPSQRCADGAVPDLPNTCAGESGSRLQAGAVQLSMPTSQAEPTAPERLVPVELVRITWTGKHRVFDIETKKHSTFLAGNNGYVGVHNCQDMNVDFLSVIHETLSASPHKLRLYAGTPKSLDNCIATLHTDSSQAEYVIYCRHGGCNHPNVPSIEHDLIDMIGPWHRDISEAQPGIVCAKCRKPLDPRRDGRWIHAFRDKRWSFAGYHVPQIIMPMHYASADSWNILLGKMAGRGNTTTTTFLNEVLGVSFDSGSKLVTLSDIKGAAVLPWKRRAVEACQHTAGYLHRILAVDWGGGGGRLSNSRSASKKGGGEMQRLRTSFTTLAVLGIKPDGKIDVLWGHRSLRTHDMEYEARLCIETVARFKCSHLVHDYGGAGAGREVLIAQAGFPLSHIVAIAYHGAAKHNLMVPKPATEDHPRDWYSVDKSRSLVITCQAIKFGMLRFFQYDHHGADDPGLLHDFLALIEEKVDSLVATDLYRISRNPNMPDDFAQAVNIGCCTLWYMTGMTPDLAAAAKMEISPEVMQHLHPTSKVEWGDL